MHVLSIETHKSKELYKSGLAGLTEVLSSVTDIHEALTLNLPPELHSELTFRILGFVNSIESRTRPTSFQFNRFVPLYHCLPINVKLSLYTQTELRKPVSAYPMSRFLTNNRGIAVLMLFANYSKWPDITNSELRLKYYTDYGFWLYKGIGSVPFMVDEFCSSFGMEYHKFRRLPVDLLFGSPNFRGVIPGQVQMLDAVNCAATPSYDLISQSRPTLNTLIQNWKMNTNHETLN